MMYDPSVLAGWTGTRNLYGEVELRWDSRRFPVHQDDHATYDRGWLVAAFAGRVHQLEAGQDYWRYGSELQRHWRLGAGPRVLAARLHVEAVTGELADVAFTELPELGGKALLRGYPRDRFRDRIATVTSLEYQWDLNGRLMASVFADVGRVFPAWRDIEPTSLRMGYGMSLQIHSNKRFLASLQLASSIDGGVFIDFAFDPVFDVQPRVEQR
jgi:outer membrane translocation and assembly module TamA